MIVASMCTIPPRKESFKLVVRRLLFEQTRQVDRMDVWLNGYDSVPSDFPTDSRLHYHIEPANPGPWVRFKTVNEGLSCRAFLTIDDDMDYPVDYVEKGLSALFSYTNPVAISFAGIRWDYLVPKADLRYGDDRTYVSLFSNVETPQKVALGTGLSSFYRPEYMKDIIEHPLPGFATNDDMMVAHGLQKRDIPIICPPRPAQWLLPLESADTEHSLFRRDVQVRHKTFRQMILQLGFDPTAGHLAQFHDKTNKVIVVERPVNDMKTLKPLEELANGDSYLHVIAPVYQSAAGIAQRYEERPFEFHPHVVPDSRASKSRFPLVTIALESIAGWKVKQGIETKIQQAKKSLNPARVTFLKAKDDIRILRHA